MATLDDFYQAEPLAPLLDWIESNHLLEADAVDAQRLSELAHEIWVREHGHVARAVPPPAHVVRFRTRKRSRLLRLLTRERRAR